MSFADTFDFGRPNAAAYVDAAGVTRIAGLDVARFDHSARTRPLGLLVDAGAEMGQGDRVRLKARDWSASSTWTVVHEWNPGSGRRSDAHYTSGPEAMINGCLGAIGHHRRIAAFAGYLRNYGGWVWALGARWELAGVLGNASGAIATGGAQLLLVR